MSYASASDPRILIGLGSATEVAELKVIWRDGAVESFGARPIRRYHVLRRGQGDRP